MYVVTGGSGFIGDALVKRLRWSEQSPVRSIDIRLPDRERTADDKVLDLLDPLEAIAAAEGADVLFHLAGPVLDGVKRDPYGAIDLQVRGTLNVLEGARRAGVKKVILASSLYVYSGMPADAVANELTPLNVLDADPFGAAKLMAERLVKHWGQLYGIPWVALRFGSVYGWGRCSNIVQSIIQAGQAGQVFEVWGQGRRRNQYTLVDDIVDGCLMAAASVENRVLNLISPESTTVAALAKLLRENGYETRFDLERPDPVSMCFMTSDAALELGWEPTPLYLGLERVVAAAKRSLQAERMDVLNELTRRPA